MGTEGRLGLDAAEQREILADFRYRNADGSPRRRTIEHPADITQGAEPFIGRVLDTLPPAAAEDFGRVDRAERLATPEAWREWLCEYTGGEVWAGDEKIPETNFLARAAVGDATMGHVKTARLRDGLAVWEKQDA